MEVAREQLRFKRGIAHRVARGSRDDLRKCS